MASTYNSNTVSTVNQFKGIWEDVDNYNYAIITARAAQTAAQTGQFVLEWAITPRGQFPSDNDIIATETISYLYSNTGITYSRDHRARWFRLTFNPPEGNVITISFETCFKTSGSELKIANDSQDIVNVKGSLDKFTWDVQLTDTSGLHLKSTLEGDSGEAIYTHLADASGKSLSYYKGLETLSSLQVAIHDARGSEFATANGSLFVTPTNVIGVPQGSTAYLRDTSDTALFIAGADNAGSALSSSKAEGFLNSLSVAIADASGYKLGTKTNPLYVDISAAPTEGVYAFDIKNGITETFTSIPNLQNRALNLFNLNTYNDSPNAIWTKIYDICSGQLPVNNSNLNSLDKFIILNIATPPKSTRDVSFPRGSNFQRGLYFRSTLDVSYSSVNGPGENVLFINGTFI